MKRRHPCHTEISLSAPWDSSLAVSYIRIRIYACIYNHLYAARFHFVSYLHATPFENNLMTLDSNPKSSPRSERNAASGSSFLSDSQPRGSRREQIRVRVQVLLLLLRERTYITQERSSSLVRRSYEFDATRIFRRLDW